jgi:succinate dehydrogenase / fumarate reductase cytochrome b subunit
MAISGLMLCGFLLVHLAGNLLLLKGPETFNHYAHTLMSNPLIIPMEIFLVVLFLGHIAMGIRLTIENKRARPQPYAMRTVSGRGSTFASSTMPYTGMFILIFLISHLLHFRFGPVYEVSYNGVSMRDIYTVVMNYFQSPLAVGWYVLAQVALAIHVSHGFHSAFASLGFDHPRYTKHLKIISKVYAFIIGAGFSFLPLWAYFIQGAAR